MGRPPRDTRDESCAARTLRRSSRSQCPISSRLSTDQCSVVAEVPYTVDVSSLNSLLPQTSIRLTTLTFLKIIAKYRSRSRKVIFCFVNFGETWTSSCRFKGNFNTDTCVWFGFIPGSISLSFWCVIELRGEVTERYASTRIHFCQFTTHQFKFCRQYVNSRR